MEIESELSTPIVSPSDSDSQTHRIPAQLQPSDLYPNLVSPVEFLEIISVPSSPVEPELPSKFSIEARGLAKTFGKKVAVSNVTLQVREGEFFGFLGPNGAGKSTTIKMLCGLLRPDGGEIRIAGVDLYSDPLEVKRLIGVLPEETNLYERLTGEEYLLFAGQMYGLTKKEAVERTASLMELMELTEER